jgi:hypothetical protein
MVRWEVGWCTGAGWSAGRVGWCTGVVGWSAGGVGWCAGGFGPSKMC